MWSAKNCINILEWYLKKNKQSIYPYWMWLIKIIQYFVFVKVMNMLSVLSSHATVHDSRAFHSASIWWFVCFKKIIVNFEEKKKPVVTYILREWTKTISQHFQLGTKSIIDGQRWALILLYRTVSVIIIKRKKLFCVTNTNVVQLLNLK